MNSDKKAQYLLNQRKLYEESSKEDLWREQKAWSQATVIVTYIAGCAIAAALFPPSFSSVPALLVSILFIMIPGLIFTLPSIFVIVFVLVNRGGTFSAPAKVLTFILIPVTITALILCLR